MNVGEFAFMTDEKGFERDPKVCQPVTITCFI